MITKQSLIIPDTKFCFVLAKKLMVTKLVVDSALATMRFVLAKKLMVTKLTVNRTNGTFSFVLAKKLMVTKPRQ